MDESYDTSVLAVHDVGAMDLLSFPATYGFRDLSVMTVSREGLLFGI